MLLCAHGQSLRRWLSAYGIASRAAKFSTTSFSGSYGVREFPSMKSLEILAPRRCEGEVPTSPSKNSLRSCNRISYFVSLIRWEPTSKPDTKPTQFLCLLLHRLPCRRPNCPARPHQRNSNRQLQNRHDRSPCPKKATIMPVTSGISERIAPRILTLPLSSSRFTVSSGE